MTYLVTLDPDDENAVSRTVPDDAIHRVLMYAFPPYADLAPGQAILIRKADYLDVKAREDVVSERPKLRLIQGGLT